MSPSDQSRRPGSEFVKALLQCPNRVTITAEALNEINMKEWVKAYADLLGIAPKKPVGD